MKKVIVICVLLVFNFCIVYAKISNNAVDKVDIKLDEEQLAIVTIKLDNSTSLLFKYQGKYILYITEYVQSKNIKSNYTIFTDYVDYIYMNNNYKYHDSRARVIDDKTFSDLRFTKEKIFFKDKVICINTSSNCNFVFINQEDIMINDSIDVVFYSNNLSDKYIDYIKKYWVDSYPISTQNYTIITIGDEYSVNNLIK